MSEWVSVKDRLPAPTGDSFLVMFCQDNDLGITTRHPVMAEYGAFVGKDNFTYWDGYDNVIVDDIITHWMPLPEPPEMKSENGLKEGVTK
jgi:hypothetical protein